MAYTYITPYSVRVSVLGNSAPLPLDEFDGVNSLHDVILSYLNDLSKPDVNEDNERAFTVEDIEVHNRGYSFIGSYGDYGFGSTFKDIRTNEVTYTRKITDAEMVPLYIRFDFPEGENRGIFIAQGLRNFGMKTLLARFLENRFKTEFEGYRIHIRPFLLGRIADSVLRGARLKAFRAIRRTIPADVAASVRGDVRETELEGSYEVIVRPKGGQLDSMMRRAGDVFAGRTPINSILELDDVVYDDVKLEVDINGKTRTFAMSDRYSINPEVDITQEVESENGHPKRESIHELAGGVSREVLVSLFGDRDAPEN